MTNIPNSENLRSKVERHEQRPVEASALLCLGAERTAKKTIIKGSRFAACSIVAPLQCMPANGKLALEQQREKIRIEYNHLGSPLEIRATMGGLSVQRCKYDSFGNIIEQSGDFELPFRFAGGIWDEDTKLIRFGVRKFQIQMSIQCDSRNQRSCHYDPEVGRWTSVEPLGFAGSRNWYVYAGNDGVNYLDLDGLLRIIYIRKLGVLLFTDIRILNLFTGNPMYLKDWEFWGAESGKGDCLNKPKCENQKNKGPIPAGEYYMDSREVSNPNFFKDLGRNILKGDWGDWRLRIHNISNKQTHRNEFFLHGGNFSGSAGCIDIGGGILGNQKTNFILMMILHADNKNFIRLTVY